MNTLDRQYKFRPESLKLTNEINSALEPIMNKALKYGFSLDAFSYLVLSETMDMINFYAIEKREEKEKEE